jgi:hypothetical protein
MPDALVLDIAENEPALADLEIRCALVGHALGLVLDLYADLSLVRYFLKEGLESSAAGVLSLFPYRGLAQGQNIPIE